MKFDEQKAKEIAGRFGINDKTIRVWKTRGKIPDRYATDGFAMRTTSKAGDIKHQRFVELLESGAISTRVLAELVQLPEIKLADAKRGKTRLSDADLNKCLIEIKRLKITIAKTFKSFNPEIFRKLLIHPLIHYSVVVDDRYLIGRIDYYRSHEVDPSELLWSQTKDKYIMFAMTLNI